MHLRILSLLLILSLGFNPSILAQTNRTLPNCPMHIIIALDFSASERGFLDEIQTVLYALTDRFELDPGNLRIGLISFNRGAQLIMPLSGETHLLEETINQLRIPLNVYATDIHAGIELANSEFKRHSVPSVPKFFILVSDGDPHAHARGFGFQADMASIQKLKAGDASNDIDPVHVFSIYSGKESAFENRFSEDVRIASILHMKRLASDKNSFFYFDEYPELVNFLEVVSNCF